MSVRSRLRAPLKALSMALLLICSASPGRADDIDIYYNPPINTANPPATILVLDLNALGICDNILTNPNSQPGCGVLQLNTTLSTLLSPLGGGSGVAGLPSSTICALYGGLLNAGLITAVVGVATTLVCNTLSGLLGGTLLGLVTNTVAGVLNPLLGTVLGNLTPTIIGVLDGALAAPLKILADPLSLVNLNSALTGILKPLINSNVAVVVSHANKYGANGTSGPVTATNGLTYSCQFADVAFGANLGTGRRSSTTQCSNGGYFLLGFFNVSSPVALVNQLLGLLLGGSLQPGNVIGSATGLVTGGLFSGGLLSASGLTSLLTNVTSLSLPLTPYFQNKENYDEIIHYLRDDPVYNGPLRTWDGPIFGPVGRDQSIENPSGSLTASYTGGSAKIGSCRTVNVINLQLTADRSEEDSDADIRNYFNATNGNALTNNANGSINFASMVQTAQTTGFLDKTNNYVKLNSSFIVQDTLAPTIASLTNAGANVLTYTSALGLFGLGQTLPQTSPLVTDATLSSTSIATSRNTATGLLDYAFVPEFRAKAGRQPSWDGNLKRLRLVRDATSGLYSYVDATTPGAAAIATDGRISTGALTYWTDPAKLGTGVTVDGRNTTLGGAGQKIPGYVFGGGGNPGRGNSDNLRQIYFDQPNTTPATSLGNLNADDQAVRNTLTASLGTTASDDERRALILRARGFDVGTTSTPKGGTGVAGVTGRSWLLGGILHSRPVAVNYGARSGYSLTDPDIRVLFGTSDGLLHSIRNGTAAAPSGTESWAFMPRAVMRYLKTLRDDVYARDFPYGVDGSPSVLVIDRGRTVNGVVQPADGTIDSSNANDHAYAFFGLRRGGSNYYGMDITNPDVPSLMWRIGTDGLFVANTTAPAILSSSTGWFSELAQTFSTPVISRITYDDGSGTSTAIADHSVLLFTGGYNGGRDSNGNRIGKDLNNSTNGTATAQVGLNDSRGNALYMVDAVTGQLIWKAVQSSSSSIVSFDSSSRSFKHPLLQDSFASDITAVDSDGDGRVDRLYVGDTGGRVWRADFPGSDRSKWTAGPIASLGRSHGTADTTNASDRRFFSAPDYIPSRGPITTTVAGKTTTTTQNYDVVLIGSGDREDPFNTATSNWVYAIRDRDTVSGKDLTLTSPSTDPNGVVVSESDSRLIKQTDLTDITTSCSAATNATCSTAVGLQNGWRLQLAAAGEKAVSAPVTINNIVTFSTYIPAAASSTRCSADEGSGRIYGVNLLDGRPFVSQFINDTDTFTRSTATKAGGIPGEVTAFTPQLEGINSDTISVRPPLIYRTFWRERREEEPERVTQ